MSLGGSSSDQSSTASSDPVDMTPAAFQGLQDPFAGRLLQLMGFSADTMGQDAFDEMYNAVLGGGGTGTSGTSGSSGSSGITDLQGDAVEFPTTLSSDQIRTIAASAGKGMPSDWRIDDEGMIWGNYGGGDSNSWINLGSYDSGSSSTSGTTSTAGTGATGYDWSSALASASDPLAGIPAYSGQLTADLTDNEKYILDKLQGFATSGQTGSDAESWLLDLLGKSTGDYATELQGASNTGAYTAPTWDPSGYMGSIEGAGSINPYTEQNPYTKEAVDSAQKQTLDNLTRTLTRDLPGRFTVEGGQFVQPKGTSAFDRAAAYAIGDTNQTLGDIATKFYYDAYDAAAGRTSDALSQYTGEYYDTLRGVQGNEASALSNFLTTQSQAAQALPGVQQADLNNLMSVLDAESLPRLIEQEGIDKGIEIYNKQVDDLMKLLGVVGGVTAPTISTTSDAESEGSGSSAQVGLGGLK